MFNNFVYNGTNTYFDNTDYYKEPREGEQESANSKNEISDSKMSDGNISFSSSVKLKTRGSKLNIIKIFNPKDDKDYVRSAYIGKRTLSLCKSNLQKCIRRQEDDKAIRTALAMYNFNPNELLRRLPIIMIEDCLPCPILFNKLVWFMCAVSKGYIMSRQELEDVLGGIATMCESTRYEVCNSVIKGSKNIDPDLSLLSVLTKEQQNFLCALEIRKAYGGMKCDEEMLTYHQNLWYNRFKTNEKTDYWTLLNNQQEYSIDLDSVDQLSKEDILLESIDYHPYPFLLKKIENRITPRLSIDRIRIAIWMCRSRVNKRKCLTPNIFVESSSGSIADYNIIHNDLENFTKWLLNKISLTE